ncbi:vWA domain-containing protein [Methyloversatilis thermotolerans]|uniref:hypothetical protein n=1 Tax=Methyloversatilis thermotolerans TaxID=1346290 RepID=UPI0003615A30|nr:hypothetical protein [Methyloversatilis thermotolerans]
MKTGALASTLAHGLRGRGTRFWLLAAATLCFGIASFDPAVRIEREVGTYMMVFDITQSMNTQDVGPADARIGRLDFAKQLAISALDQLPCGTQVGVSIFVERRTQPLLMPVDVCRSRGSLADAIDHIDWRMAWAADSHLYYGTYSALDDIRRMAPGAALAFFTDGHQTPALHPGRIPSWDGKPGEVPGVLFGVGGESPEPVPKLGEKGRIEGYWTPEDTAGFASAGAPTLSVADMERMGGDIRNAPQRAPGSENDHLSLRRDDILEDLSQRTGLATAVARSADQVARQLRALPGGRTAETRMPLRPLLALAGLALLIVSLAPASVARLLPARARPASRLTPVST